MNKSLSLKEFINYKKTEYNVDVTSIISNGKILYLRNNFINNILDEKLEDIYNSISNTKLFENQKYIMLEIGGDIGNM